MLDDKRFSRIATSGNLFYRRKARRHFKASGEIVFGSPNERMAVARCEAESHRLAS